MQKTIFEYMKAGNIMSVEQWNRRREKAKLNYSPEDINRLDASGLCGKILYKPKVEFKIEEEVINGDD